MKPAGKRSDDTQDLEQSMIKGSNLRRPLLVILAVVFVVVGLSLFASAYVKVAGAIVASGELRVLTQKTLIRHETGGRISELLIDNGQEVQAGQVVLRLNPDQIDLSRSKLLTEIDSLERQSQRLRAILQQDLRQDGDEIAYSLSSADLEAREGVSIRAVVSRIVAFNKADTSDIKAIRAVLELQDEQTDLLKVQVEELEETALNTEQLVLRGLETELRLREVRNTLRAQQVSLVESQKVATQSRREITSLEAQIAKRIFEFQQSSLEELIAVEDDLARLEAELSQVNEQLSKLELRAGLSGRVTNLAELNVGAVLKAGDVVAEIIPVEQEVMAEVFVSAREIDLLGPGTKALLEITTLKRASEQRIKAEVELIAADLKIFEDGTSAFPVQVRLIDASALPFELARNGVPVTSYIPTAERSLGSYLITPIIRWTRKTFTEY